MKILVISGSSREEGNTELLTEKVVEGLDCTRLYLRKMNVQAIVDQRHAPEGFRWSQSLRDPRFDFKNRIKTRQAWVVVTGGPDARLKGLPLIQQFAHIFQFVSMEFAGYLIGTGGKPGQVLEDERALLEAGWLNRLLRSKAAETAPAN